MGKFTEFAIVLCVRRLNSDLNQPHGSDVESEEENEEGDYTVFECPGLATVSLDCHRLTLVSLSSPERTTES